MSRHISRIIGLWKRSALIVLILSVLQLVFFRDSLIAYEAHGGSLVDRFVSKAEFNRMLEKTKKNLEVSKNRRDDIECIAAGIYSPLTGFMNEKDYVNVVSNMRLKNGLLWSIPITLSATRDFTKALKAGDLISLSYDNKKIAILKVGDIYAYDKENEKQKVYGTTDIEHPGVKLIHDQPENYIGGEIFVLEGSFDTDPFSEQRLYPKQSRQAFKDKGWETIVAFQTRNPLHRAHEHIQKSALETVDALFLNPLVGATKDDDVPADVRMKTYNVMIDNYYNKDRVLLSVFPAAMRYGGPKEAILHAIARQNYGCTHIIIGRDHAGVKKYYGPYDAQKIFSSLKNGDLKINIVKFENAFYCKATNTMGTEKTCPATSEQFHLSGTEVRNLLKQGKPLPPEMTRPEVASILSSYYNQLEK